MYVWRNKQRRDRRNLLLDGVHGWGAPKGSENTTLEDEQIRQEREKLFVSNFVQQMRKLIVNYLATEDGKYEINHVIEAIDKINTENDKLKDPKERSVPPEMKKKKNVYEIFKTFDTDGSETIDREELAVLLDHLNVPMKPEDFEKLINSLDIDGSGEIQFDEFYEWFVEEANAHRSKSRFSFLKKASTDLIYNKFKRMVLEVEARNLVVEKVVADTERDARLEFRIAHPPLLPCPQCFECFLHAKEYHEHLQDNKTHEEFNMKQNELKSKFKAVEMAFEGAIGRKLHAHRLLYSIDLNGFESRLKNVKESLYRPHISDPAGRREEQLRQGMLVLGSDPRGGIRGHPTKINYHDQYRSQWAEEHNNISLHDALVDLNYIQDEKVDIVVTSDRGAHAEVVIEWKHCVRYDIFIIGEFNNWKPEMMYSNKETSIFSIVKILSPGRYRYRFVVDGSEVINPDAATVDDGGMKSNIVMVMNPRSASSSRMPKTSKTLVLRNSNICDGVWSIAAIIQQNSTLEVLDLSNNSISDDGMIALCHSCKCLGRLTVLKLNGNGFTYDGCRYLHQVFSQSTRIMTLELANNRIGDDGAEMIGQIIKYHPTIKHIILDTNYIGNDGAAALGLSLTFNRTVTTLSLAENRIRTPGMERLCFYLRSNAVLSELDISSNPLGPDAIKHVGELVAITDSIQILNLCHTQMVLARSMQGLLAVTSGIKKNRSIKTLIMKSNQLINDDAVEIAYALTQNRCILNLDLTNNQISDEWFEPNLVMRTKVMANMPSIATSLNRNKEISGQPELSAKFAVKQRSRISDCTRGHWTHRRKWKADKAVENVDVPQNEQDEIHRIQAENDYVADGLERHTTYIAAFLSSKEGMNLIHHVEKVIRSYLRSMGSENEAATSGNEWVNECHTAIIVALLTSSPSQQQTQGMVVHLTPPPENDAINRRSPLLDKYELPVFVPTGEMKHVYQFYGLSATETDYKAAVEASSLQDLEGQIITRKFMKYFISNYSTIAKRSILGHITKKTMNSFKSYHSLAHNFITQSSYLERKVRLRKEYRSNPKHEPKFLCNYCGERFKSERSLKHHEEKRNVHYKFNQAEKVQLSQLSIIRRAKWLITGTFFPAYYELCNVLLLPENYAPQIFDERGEEGRPIGVIEPHLTYRIEDILGDWLQVVYRGERGWMQYKFQKLQVMLPAFKHRPHFWDNLNTFPKFVYYKVSDILPGQIEIKVRQMPEKDAVVCGSLTKGMVVAAAATLNDWLQIVFNEIDAAWILRVNGGGIELVEELHESLQMTMPNIMKNSPAKVHPKHLEVILDAHNRAMLSSTANLNVDASLSLEGL